MGGLQSISLNSALIDHIKNSNLAGCQSALSQGADVNADFNGKSALRLSLERGDPGIFELLHSVGGEIRPRTADTALHIAVAHSQVGLVKHLLRTQPSLKNITNGEGQTALHVACIKKDPEMIALLLKYNVQSSLKDNQGLRAMDYGLGGLMDQFLEDDLQVRSPSSSQRAVSARENTHCSSTFYTDFEKSTGLLEKALKNSKIPIVKSTDLEIGEMLSRGSSSTVFNGRWRGSEVAVKKFKPEYSMNTKDILKFIKEMQMLDQVRHPNLLLFMGICVDNPHLCIISELAIHGSLFKVLHKSKIKLSFEDRHKIAIQITQGLVYLHSCDPPIVHRDLKPENCLLDSAFNVKIADFGLARPANWFMEEGQKSSVCIGTTRFMAPELFDREQIEFFGPKIDVWALGCIFIELYSNKRPWGHISSSNSDKIREEVFQRKPVPIPDNVPERISNIIALCCEYDINIRAAAAEVLDMLISVS